MLLSDNTNENIKSATSQIKDKSRPNYINSPLLTNKSEMSCETSSLSYSMKENNNNNTNRNTSISLSFSSSSSSTKTNTTKTTISSMSSSLESLDFDRSNRLNFDEDQKHYSALYYKKKFYGKEWLFKKLHEYLINKVYEKSFFLVLIGDSGNGKTHLCCELKWPTNNENLCLTDLNKHLISTYFLSLYNLVQCSYNKNLQKLYSHLKSTIIREISKQIESIEVLNCSNKIAFTTETSDTSSTNNADEDEDVDESDEKYSKNDTEEYYDHIVNKYATKFNENVVVNVLNKYSNEIAKLNKNFYILIDGVDELLLYDQYLMVKNRPVKSNNDSHNNQNFNIIIKFLNKIFLKFPKWLHLVVTCKRITEKQCLRNKFFNIKNYFKLSIDTCVSLNNAYLNILNENSNQNSEINRKGNNYSLVSYLSQTPAPLPVNKLVISDISKNNVISSSSSSKSSTSPSSSESRLTSSSSSGEKPDLTVVPQNQILENSTYSSSSTQNTIQSSSIHTKAVSSAEILNAAHFASLKDIQIYILKRLDNDNDLKLKFNKLNAIEMLNLLLIKSNNCLLYVEKVLDLILSNIINSREIRDIPVTIYGLYLFLIERLLTDLDSGAADFLHGQHESQPPIHQLIYSIFNLFIVELKPLSKLKVYLKLKLRYRTLDYNYYEYIFNSITPILFTKCEANPDKKYSPSKLKIMKNQEYILFHSSLIEWFSDVKFCTNKYLSNLSEGHFILTLFYLTKFKKYSNLNEQQNTQLNYRKHKNLLKLLKKFQFHLVNSNRVLTCVEYNYVLNLCESSTSLQLNYDIINNVLFNCNKKNNNNSINDTFSQENRISSCSFSNLNNFHINNNNSENMNETLPQNNDNFTTTFSNYSINKHLNVDLNPAGITDTHQIILFNFVLNGKQNLIRLIS